MESVSPGTLLGLIGLGAFHGINPGMGWLFAVARGLQEGRRVEVWRTFLPLGFGHALAVGVAVLVTGVAGRALPLEPLRWATAALLLTLGARRLVRHRHPRWRGMRVGMGGIALWSFLMASAHGAGLMVVPFLLSDGGCCPISGESETVGAALAAHGAGVAPASHSIAAISPVTALLLTALHAFSYLALSALIAVVVYEKVGIRFLRHGWLNLDAVWAIALLVAGGITLVMPG